MSEVESWTDVLNSLRECHARHGGGGFTLGVFTDEVARERGLQSSLWMGSVSSPNGIYTVYADAGMEGAFDVFQQIASHAGAKLPLKMRKEFMQCREDPLSEWLSFMYHWAPPAQPRHPCVAHGVWLEPFGSAADAIERSGLLPQDARAADGPDVTATDPQDNGRRGGRLPKDDSAVKRTTMLAMLRQHPTLKDDPAELARLIGVSQSTIRRWIQDEERKYLESMAANPAPAEE